MKTKSGSFTFLLVIISLSILFYNLSFSQERFNITQVFEGDLAVINGGTNNGLKVGNKLIVKRYIESDYNYIDVGTIEIIKVIEDLSTVRFVRINTSGNLEVDDLVFESESDFRKMSGFRDLVWGTNINTVADLIFQYTDPSYGGIDIYSRIGDELKIGTSKLDFIVYGFWQGKLYSVTIQTSGYMNFIGLKDACIEKFGNPYKPNIYIEEYVWSGDITDGYLGYNEFSEKAVFRMSSYEIVTVMNNYKLQRAKEGAMEDF